MNRSRAIITAAVNRCIAAVWLASNTIGPKESRAIKCSIKLDQPRIHHDSPNWTIFPGGGRLCGFHNRVIHA